tara:strand:+ start:18 stop:668 length:651 start_codon:yes stop_codon:yes gene_type:complete
MWTLYAFTTIGFVAYFVGKVYRKFYPLTMKSFEDTYEKDEYKLLCFRIKFEDNSVINKFELTKEEIEEIEKENKIKYITIDYMFNGQFMKYITYEKDITFPFYVFKVTPPRFKYFPETIILNGVDITPYITPYLGPLSNFYNDRSDPIKLEDALCDHPDFKSFDLNNGQLIMISNDTPIEGKKCITKELPCKLLWKRHAAVDPKDDDKLKDFELID